MAKKRAKAKSGAAPATGDSKSKAIRDYMAANRNAGPKAVAEALSEQGIKVSAAFVSTVKSMAKKRKPGRKVGRPKGTTAVAAGDRFSVSQLLQAKKLAEQMGGVEKAKAAMDALAKLV